jgi:hypothetical protein
MQKVFLLCSCSLSYAARHTFAAMHPRSGQIRTFLAAFASVHRLVCLAACTVVSSGLDAQATDVPVRAANTLRIGLLITGADRDAMSFDRGVRLGTDEARQTARLFGSDVQLYEASADRDAVASAARLSSNRQVQVIIGGSAADADALAAWAEGHHVLFLNIASRSDQLRAACRRYTFHIAASEAMYANAVRLGRGIPSRQAGSGDPAAPELVTLWASTLERYGAAQINDRYRARYKAPMDGMAWAGWFAAKVASESALRVRSPQPAQLLAYLESPSTSFDGHKGWPLSFRLADHQLRQPLYIGIRSGLSQGFAFRDVPELREASAAGSGRPTGLNLALDRLMGAPTAPSCKWKH